MVTATNRDSALWRQLVAWIDNSAGVADEDPERIDWLRVVPFVGMHAASSLHRVLVQAATEAGATMNWRIQVTSFDAACAMVAAGLGVSIVPRAATTAYTRSLALAVVPLDNPWAKRQLFLCSRSNAPMHSAARQLFEHLRQQR